MKLLHNDCRVLGLAEWVGRAGAALLLAGLIVSGCGRLRITGEAPGNQTPQLILVNTPPGGQLLGANPTVYWYGTDIDGRIVRYDYAVVRLDSAADKFSIREFLARHNDVCPGTSEIERFMRCARDSMPWVSIFVDSSKAVLPTQSRIPLYASFDTLDCDSETYTYSYYSDSTHTNVDSVAELRRAINCVSLSVDQYMFIRAADDQGDLSDIKYRSFLRDNHWPETRISTFEPYRIYFSLPSLTETYKGIRVTWAGLDNLDFLPGQAKLDFHWRLYGPYAIGGGTLLDRPKLGDTSFFAAPILESQSGDPRKGVWVADTNTILYNLWRQADSLYTPSDTTRTAFFLLVVQARDDASVADPTPAWTTFQAVFAKFERKLLLVDETAYGISPGGYPSWDPDGRGSAKAQSSDTNQAFLFRMADSIVAGIHGPHDSWRPELDFWQRVDQRQLCTDTLRCATTVPVTELSRHELVLYADDDWVQPITKDPDGRVPLSQYLDVGGKLWLMSRIGFLNGTDIGPGSGPKLFDFMLDKNSFPARYFGISGLYFPGYYGVAKGIQEKPPASNDEFIAADAIESNDPGLKTPSNLPRSISIDSVRLERHWLDLRKLLLTDVIRGVPNVGYVQRWTDAAAPGTRPLYVFRSWRPGYSGVDQRLVAVRTVGPTLQTPKYKTAFLGCPLWFFKEAEISEYVKGMTDWFYNQPIELGP